VAYLFRLFFLFLFLFILVIFIIVGWSSTVLALDLLNYIVPILRLDAKLFNLLQLIGTSVGA
jgi:hypothetical protein